MAADRLGWHTSSKFVERGINMYRTNEGFRSFSWFCVICAPMVSSTAFGDVYHSAAHGYSIVVPDGWIAIPDDVLDAFTEFAINADQRDKLINDMAFQASADADWFTHPYVVVQVIPYVANGISRQPSEADLPKLVQMLTGKNIKERSGAIINEAAKTYMPDFESDEPVLDSGNHCFRRTVSMNVVGVGSVRGLSVGHFGKDAIIQVAFFAKSENAEQLLPIGNSIANSFQFSPSRAFDETLAERDAELTMFNPRLVRAVRRGGTICVIAVLAVILIRRLGSPKGRKSA